MAKVKTKLEIFTAELVKNQKVVEKAQAKFDNAKNELTLAKDAGKAIKDKIKAEKDAQKK
jgi:hypothetical protein